MTRCKMSMAVGWLLVLKTGHSQAAGSLPAVMSIPPHIAAAAPLLQEGVDHFINQVLI